MSILASHKEVLAEVKNFDNLGFFSKSKNQLTLFYIACIALTFAYGLLSNINIVNINVMLGSLIYLALAPFIFLNQKWSMYTAAFLYSLDKVAIVLNGSLSNIVGAAAFGYFCVLLTYKAIQVSKALKSASTSVSEDRTEQSPESELKTAA